MLTHNVKLYYTIFRGKMKTFGYFYFYLPFLEINDTGICFMENKSKNHWNKNDN